MNVLNYPGEVGEVIREVAAGFEQEYGVSIKWSEGTGADTVAKVASSVADQHFDAAFSGDTSIALGTARNLWADLDEDVVDTSSIYKELRSPSNDAVPIGLNETTLYYNKPVFDDNGWRPPDAFTDLLDQKYCNRVGISDISVVYGLHTVLGLGSLTKEEAAAGDIEPAFGRGLERLKGFKDCIQTFETSTATLSGKIQSGEYVVGTNGSVRIFPMIEQNVPIDISSPETGNIANVTYLAPVKDAPNAELSQLFVSWFLRPESQAKIMEKLYYAPGITDVQIPAELKELGLPSGEDMSNLVVLNLDELAGVYPDLLDNFHQTIQ